MTNNPKTETSRSPNKRAGKKRACIHCREKRRKCDMKNPCSNCELKAIKCVIIGEDLRTKRHTVSYVNTLEAHIDQLQSLLLQIKDTRNDIQRNKLIDNLTLTKKRESDHEVMLLDINQNDRPGSSLSTEPRIINIPRPVELKELDMKHSPSSLKENILPIREGSPLLNDTPSNTPTALQKKISAMETNSIYPSNSLLIKKRDSKMTEQANHIILKNLSRSPLILRSLSLFFKWLYPGHYMFIHRETFLSAFFRDPSTKSYYCSEELVYAIAALGARAAHKSEELYLQSEVYYQHAKQIVLTKIFQLIDRSLADATSSSKLAIIQTLLCLSFYDVAKAENPMAWYLSGLAFRISHEIGLHLNPEAWNHVYEDELTRMDYAVRSRIYWGCYIADHLMSVLFGRSTTLRMSNSSVPETDELPDIETGIEDYIFKPGVPTQWVNPLKKLIYLSRISEVFATKIFAQTDSIEQRCDYLIKFNQEMHNWRTVLPSDIKWDKKFLEDLELFDPTVMYMWFHYYIVLISYNKPFISELDESKDLVETYIEELYLLFNVWKKNYPTYERCDLYMIYSAILCVQCMNTNLINKKYHQFFKGFLDDESINYEVAKNFIENNNNINNNNNMTGNSGVHGQDNHDEINHTEFTGLFGSLTNGNDFALEYNFDFTLLNEIDKLISKDD
ncbi:activatory protein Cha4p [Monosporozyma servazzii]